MVEINMSLKSLIFLVLFCFFFCYLVVAQNNFNRPRRPNTWPWLGLGGAGGFPPGGQLLPGLAGLFGQQSYGPPPSRVTDCPTTDGNRTGICVASPYECRSRGGRILGTCYATPQSGSQIVPQQPSQGGIGFGSFNPGIPVGVCCFYQVTCGGTVLYNGTYFRNPNAPAPYPDSGTCTVTIPRIRPDMCQLRLDFLSLSLRQPNAGNCDTDRLVVSGQSPNNVIPALCGQNSGQHRENQGAVMVNVLTVGNRNRLFDIRVTQIPCTSPYKAPTSCLQHHFGVVGEIRSFNFDFYNQGFNYFNNLDYTICFHKQTGFCTITYSIPKDNNNQNDIDLPPDARPPPPPSSTDDRYLGIKANTDITNAAGAGHIDCPADYLLLNGLRFCGTKLNDNLYLSSNPTTNVDVVDNSTGPIYARFVTNVADVQKGFLLNYRMNPCLINGR